VLFRSPMLISPISCDETDQHGRGYPRPQLRRDTWYSLNGLWDFALDPAAAWRTPDQVEWSERIRVPFAAEAQASRIAHTGFFRACWYRIQCELPGSQPNERWILHFGAVDWRATIWINGIYAGEHEGGYTPFNIDITDLASGSACDIVLRAEDDPHDLAKPRQAGLAARTPLHLVSPHVGNLADRVARKGSGHPHRPRGFHAQPRALGNRSRGVARRRTPG